MSFRAASLTIGLVSGKASPQNNADSIAVATGNRFPKSAPNALASDNDLCGAGRPGYLHVRHPSTPKEKNGRRVALDSAARTVTPTIALESSLPRQMRV